MYWLKQNVGKTEIDEITAAAYLDKLRSEVEGNLGLSFGTISAYSDNAAMCHYAVSEESNKKLMPRGLYLVDSGGQYLEGTTDITRTFALGRTDGRRERMLHPGCILYAEIVECQIPLRLPRL